MVDTAINVFKNAAKAEVGFVKRTLTGGLVSWVENGFNFNVTRIDTDRTLIVNATIESRGLRAREVFKFDTYGNLLSSSGDSIPTVFASELRASGIALFPYANPSRAAMTRRAIGSRRNRHSPCFEYQISGQLGANGADNVTRQTTIRLPDNMKVVGIRICFHNSRAEVLSTSALMRVHDDIGDTLYNDVPLHSVTPGNFNWRRMQLNGSDTITMPAEVEVPNIVRVAAPNFELPGTVLTDFIPIPQMGRYITIRDFMADWRTRATNLFSSIGGPTGTLLTHGLVSAIKVGTDAVSNLAGFTGVTYDGFLHGISIVFYTEHDVRSVLYFSGSSNRGLDDDPTEAPEPGAGLGWMSRGFFRSFSDGGQRISYGNACLPAGCSAEMLELLKKVCADGNTKHGEIAMRLITGDDEQDIDYLAGVAGGTLAAFMPYCNRIIRQAILGVEACADAGKACRLIINHPSPTWSGAFLEAAFYITNWARSYAATGACFLDDGVADELIDNNLTATTVVYQRPAQHEGGPVSPGPHWNGYGQQDKAIRSNNQLRADGG